MRLIPFVLLLKMVFYDWQHVLVRMGGPVENMGGGRGEGRIKMRGDEREGESIRRGDHKVGNRLGQY